MPSVLFNNAKICRRTRGIVQIGSNTGQECPEIQKWSIKNQIHFEPERSCFDQLLRYTQEHKQPGETVFLYNLALSDKVGDFPFWIGKDLQNSSFLDLNPERTQFHKDANEHSHQEIVSTITLDHFWETHKEVSPKGYNLLLIDTQGTELEVFKGASNSLKGFDFICTEVSYFPIYTGTAPAEEITSFLATRGFRLYDQEPPITNIGKHQQANVIYVKEGVSL